MKRILLITTIFALIFCCTACSKRNDYPTDEQVLQDMQDNISKVSDYATAVSSFSSTDTVLDENFGSLTILGNSDITENFGDGNEVEKTIEVKVIYRVLDDGGYKFYEIV